MRTIKMKKTAAGPFGNFDSGRTYLVEDSLAGQFVDGGAAEYQDRGPENEDRKREAEDVPVIETAVLPVEEIEQAVAPSPKPRGRRKAK